LTGGVFVSYLEENRWEEILLILLFDLFLPNNQPVAFGNAKY
jgi:hypothetical protein